MTEVPARPPLRERESIIRYGSKSRKTDSALQQKTSAKQSAPNRFIA